MIVLRIFLLLCSLFGAVWFLSEKTRPEFAPGLAMAGIGSVMFLAGILRCLPAAAVLVCAAGLFLLLLQLRKRADAAGVFRFSSLVLLAACLYFLPMLYGLKLNGYDDFSHWGVVARILITEDRFPNLSDPLVAFQAYPPGSAALIYYFVKIGGVRAEWAWLYAQAAAVLSLYMGLFAFCRTKRDRLVTLLVFLILLCSNIFFINLLVDSLITACALNGMCLALYYRDDPVRIRWWLLPCSVFLLAIKTSGIFYVLVLFGYVLLKSRGTAAWKKLLPVLLISFLPLLLWRVHVRLVFPEGMVTKHAFSLEYFSRTVADKDWNGVKYILARMILKTLSPQLEAIYLVLFLVVLSLLFRKELFRKGSFPGEILLLILISAAAYLFMVFLMYLLSMPWYEASQLAGFERYLRTFTGYAAGLFTVALLSLPAPERQKRLPLLPLLQAAWIVLLLFTMGRRSDFYLRWPMERERRTYADALLAQQEIPSDRPVLIKVTDEEEDCEYVELMFQYLLNRSDVTVLPPGELPPESDARTCELVWSPGPDVHR